MNKTVFELLKDSTIDIEYCFDDYDFTYSAKALDVYDLIYDGVVKTYFVGVVISDKVKEGIYDLMWNEGFESLVMWRDSIKDYFESEAYTEWLIKCKR